MGLLDHMVTLFLVFWGTWVIALTYVPTNNVRGISFLQDSDFILKNYLMMKYHDVCSFSQMTQLKFVYVREWQRKGGGA